MLKRAIQSRKFWVTVALLGTATVALFTGRLSSDQWIEVAKWVGPGYLIGQGIADAARK